MPPRKNKDTKGKANKRVKSTHTPVSDVVDTKSSPASDQDSQPASYSTLGKRNRPVVPESDDEWVTDDETEDGSPVVSHPPTDSDLSDVIMRRYRLLLSHYYDSDDESHMSDIDLQNYWLLLSHYREPTFASEDIPPTYGELIRTLNRLYQDFPSVLKRALSAPPSDLLAKSEALIAESEALIAKLEAPNAKLHGVQKQCTKTLARRTTVFRELERVFGPRPYDTHNFKLAAFLDRIRDGRVKLLEMGKSHQEISWVL